MPAYRDTHTPHASDAKLMSNNPTALMDSATACLQGYDIKAYSRKPNGARSMVSAAVYHGTFLSRAAASARHQAKAKIERSRFGNARTGPSYWPRIRRCPMITPTTKNATTKTIHTRRRFIWHLTSAMTRARKRTALSRVAVDRSVRHRLVQFCHGWPDDDRIGNAFVATFNRRAATAARITANTTKPVPQTIESGEPRSPSGPPRKRQNTTPHRKLEIATNKRRTPVIPLAMRSPVGCLGPMWRMPNVAVQGPRKRGEAKRNPAGKRSLGTAG